jgi:peptidoglycan/LPS O-acetylase OafA/YrhL
VLADWAPARGGGAMGVLRLALAISVVIVHSVPLFGLTLVGGRLAVQAFFIISGFYMSLILDTKYGDTKEGTYLFYSNRFLRIYPLYWSVLLIAIVVSVLEQTYPAIFHSIGVLPVFEQYWSTFDWATRAYLVASNFSVLGLDLGFLFRLDQSSLHLTTQYYMYRPQAYQFDFVPQAWSLSLEAMVYAMAPYLFRRSIRTLICLLFVSFCLRAAGSYAGLKFDPWLGRFLPFEIGWFLAGALGYRAYRVYGLILGGKIGIAAMIAILALLLAYPAIPDPGTMTLGLRTKDWFFLGPVAVCIPAIFAASKQWKVDRWIGELSYPVYLSHLIIIAMCYGDFGWLGLKPVIGTLGLSIVIVTLLDAPLERYRQARVWASKQLSTEVNSDRTEDDTSALFSDAERGTSVPFHVIANGKLP